MTPAQIRAKEKRQQKSAEKTRAAAKAWVDSRPSKERIAMRRFAGMLVDTAEKVNKPVKAEGIGRFLQEYVHGKKSCRGVGIKGRL